MNGVKLKTKIFFGKASRSASTAPLASSRVVLEERRRRWDSSSRASASHRHPLFVFTSTLAKGRSNIPAKARARETSSGCGTTKSGRGQSSLSHWTTAKAARETGFSRSQLRRRAGGVASKTNAEGKGREARFLQRRQISSSISSKQWRHLLAGSMGEQSSQQPGQKNRVRQFSWQEAHKGGKMRSSQGLKKERTWVFTVVSLRTNIEIGS